MNPNQLSRIVLKGFRHVSPSGEIREDGKNY